MDFTILLGIISSVVAVVGILVSGYLIYLDSRDLKPISKGRKRAINGRWMGHLERIEAIRDLYPEGTLEMTLQAKRKRVRGKVILRISAGEMSREDHLIVKGGFKMDRFLELNFHNANDEIVQFGNLIVELSGMGDRMEGHLHGYGPVSKRVMGSKIILTKAT